MKNLHTEDTNVMDFIARTEKVIPDKKKKMMRDLFRPKYGLSIIKKDTMSAGASPSTVNR